MDNQPQPYQPQPNGDNSPTPPNHPDNAGGYQQTDYTQPQPQPMNPEPQQPAQPEPQPQPAEPQMQSPQPQLEGHEADQSGQWTAPNEQMNEQPAQDPQTFPLPQQPAQPPNTQQPIQPESQPQQPMQQEQPPTQPQQPMNPEPQQPAQPEPQPQPAEPQMQSPQPQLEEPASYQQADSANPNDSNFQNQPVDTPQPLQNQNYTPEQTRPAYDTIETTPHPQLHPAGDSEQDGPPPSSQEPETAQEVPPTQPADSNGFNQPEPNSFPQLESHLPPIGPSPSSDPQPSPQQPPVQTDQVETHTPPQAQAQPQTETTSQPSTPNQPDTSAPQTQSQPQPQQPPATQPAHDNQAFTLPGSEPQAATNQPAQDSTPNDNADENKESIGAKLKRKAGNINYKPIMSAAIVGMLVFGIFNSQVILGQVQYLTTPSGGIDVNTSESTEVPVGDEDRILIPQIDVDVPVVDEPSFDEDLVQAALEDGVVHYGNTAKPGEIGNSVLVGHSSNDWWDAGDYKYAFILLDRLQNGDEIVIHHEGTRYVYEVYDSYVVEPTDISVLEQPDDESILTLITCTPPGTSWQRLIVEAEQVSPDPADNIDRDEDADQDAVEELPRDSGNRWFNIF